MPEILVALVAVAAANMYVVHQEMSQSFDAMGGPDIDGSPVLCSTTVDQVALEESNEQSDRVKALLSEEGNCSLSFNFSPSSIHVGTVGPKGHDACQLPGDELWLPEDNPLYRSLNLMFSDLATRAREVNAVAFEAWLNELTSDFQRKPTDGTEGTHAVATGLVSLILDAIDSRAMALCHPRTKIRAYILSQVRRERAALQALEAVSRASEGEPDEGTTTELPFGLTPRLEDFFPYECLIGDATEGSADGQSGGHRDLGDDEDEDEDDRKPAAKEPSPPAPGPSGATNSTGHGGPSAGVPRLCAAIVPWNDQVLSHLLEALRKINAAVGPTGDLAPISQIATQIVRAIENADSRSGPIGLTSLYDAIRRLYESPGYQNLGLISRKALRGIMKELGQRGIGLQTDEGKPGDRQCPGYAAQVEAEIGNHTNVLGDEESLFLDDNEPEFVVPGEGLGASPGTDFFCVGIGGDEQSVPLDYWEAYAIFEGLVGEDEGIVELVATPVRNGESNEGNILPPVLLRYRYWLARIAGEIFLIRGNTEGGDREIIEQMPRVGRGENIQWILDLPNGYIQEAGENDSFWESKG